MYTIRKCIQEMKHVHTNVVVCNNGTKIFLPELYALPEEEPFSRFKGEGRILRRMLCTIVSTERTVMVSELKQNKSWWLYDPKDEAWGFHSFFGPNDYMLPERVMNQFISANDGIDHYLTVAMYGYMLADMREATEGVL